VKREKEDIPAIKEKETLMSDKEKIILEIDCLLNS
jgi:hypothetical protein